MEISSVNRQDAQLFSQDGVDMLLIPDDEAAREAAQRLFPLAVAADPEETTG